MRIGATPTHNFTLPVSVGLIDGVEIIYKQNGEEVLFKTKDDCTLSGNKVSTTLTQNETFQFDTEANVEIQIRAMTTEGKVLISDIFCVSAERCLFDGVM